MDDLRRKMFDEEQAKLPPNERIAGPDEQMCLEQDDGYKCTSAKGHEGGHTSCGVLGMVHHRWSKETK